MEGPRARADWNLVSGIYRQLAAIIADPHADYIPPLLPGFLAEALTRAAAFYTQDVMQMADDLLKVLNETDPMQGSTEERFHHFYGDSRVRRFDYYRPSASGRMRPTPFESGVETCRRLRDLQMVRNKVKLTGSGVVLGGSTSYGKFLNVSGIKPEKDGSDIDLLISIEEADQLDAVVDALAEVPGIEAPDVTTMRSRISHYKGFQSALESPCVFSQKVSLWKNDYDKWLQRFAIQSPYKISLHCFTREGFETLLVGDLTVLDQGERPRRSRILYDYRQDIPSLRLDHQRSLAGTNLFLERPFTKVEEGFLTESRVFVIDQDDRYYPGMFQNLILPQFELVAENQAHSMRSQLDLFRWKIVERLRKERQLRPYELLRLSLSHTRSSVFAPHIVRQIDNL